MKRIIFIITICLHLSVSSYAREITFSIGFSENHPLFKASERICREISDLSEGNIHIILKSIPLERSTNMLIDGTIDGDWARTRYAYDYSPGIIRVEPSILLSHYYVYTNQDILSPDIKLLNEYTLVIKIGDAIINNFAQSNKLKIIYVHREEQVWEMMAAGRADYFIGPFFSSNILLNPDFEKLGIRRLDDVVFSEEIYLYLHDKNKDLLPLFSRTIQDMKQRGRIMELISGRENTDFSNLTQLED